MINNQGVRADAAYMYWRSLEAMPVLARIKNICYGAMHVLSPGPLPFGISVTATPSRGCALTGQVLYSGRSRGGLNSCIGFTPQSTWMRAVHENEAATVYALDPDLAAPGVYASVVEVVNGHILLWSYGAFAPGDSVRVELAGAVLFGDVLGRWAGNGFPGLGIRIEVGLCRRYRHGRNRTLQHTAPFPAVVAGKPGSTGGVKSSKRIDWD